MLKGKKGTPRWASSLLPLSPRWEKRRVPLQRLLVAPKSKERKGTLRQAFSRPEVGKEGVLLFPSPPVPPPTLRKKKVPPGGLLLVQKSEKRRVPLGTLLLAWKPEEKRVALSTVLLHQESFLLSKKTQKEEKTQAKF